MELVPPKVIYHVGFWSYTQSVENAGKANKALDEMVKGGWYLVSVSAGLAYWQKENPEYLKYLENENKRLRSKRVR